MTRFLVFAYSGVGQVCLNSLLQRGESVVGVVTHEPSVNEHLWFTPPQTLAQAYGVPVFTPTNPNTPEVYHQLQDLRPDVIFSFYYRLMLGEPILQLAPLGAFNMHGSLLPRYRGRSPVNWAILKGEIQTGVTLHQMVRQADAGAIVDQRQISIGENDTAGDVMNAVMKNAVALLSDNLEAIKKGQASAHSQDLSLGSYFGGRSAADSIVDWHQPAEVIHNLIRSQLPYPICHGATTFYQDQPLRLLGSRVVPSSPLLSFPAGQILSLDPLHVTTGSADHLIEITDYQWIGEEKLVRVGEHFTETSFLAQNP